MVANNSREDSKTACLSAARFRLAQQRFLVQLSRWSLKFRGNRQKVLAGRPFPVHFSLAHGLQLNENAKSMTNTRTRLSGLNHGNGQKKPVRAISANTIHDVGKSLTIDRHHGDVGDCFSQFADGGHADGGNVRCHNHITHFQDWMIHRNRFRTKDV